MNQSTVMTLAQWLAGEFDNRPQAIDQPAWFVHLRWWHRPLPRRIQGNLAIFAEQANALYLDRPYRQRVMVLYLEANALQVQYWALRHPERFQGAGANADLLNHLQLDDLEKLSGCVLTVAVEGDRFQAQPQPNTACYFQYEGQTRQVILGFEVSTNQYWSHDRGVDPETGQSLWGALMGAYEFNKYQDFAGEIPA